MKHVIKLTDSIFPPPDPLWEWLIREYKNLKRRRYQEKFTQKHTPSLRKKNETRPHTS